MYERAKEAKEMMDKDEKQIYEAFSQIKVDASNLERKVLENMDIKKAYKVVSRKKKSFVAAASIAVLMLVVGTVYAATTGAFDRFMNNHQSAFREVVTPVERYVVDQGIRIEVIATQSFMDNAFFYVSMQDTTGQNRITRDAYIPARLRSMYGVGIYGTGSSELVYFDDATNVAYFRLWIQNAQGIANEIELVIDAVFLGTPDINTIVEGDWSMVVYTTETSNQVHRWNGEQPLGSGNILNSISLSPIGVSFVGTAASMDLAFELFEHSLQLETTQGNILILEGVPQIIVSQWYDSLITFNGFIRSETLINVDEVVSVLIGDVGVGVQYIETYTPMFQTRYWSGSKEIGIQSHLTFVGLSPHAVYFVGSTVYPHLALHLAEFDFYLETPQGNIPLSLVEMNVSLPTFDGIISGTMPVDVSMVTAVLMGDIRIPL